jgi:Tfp pilus assembly protein PilP
MLDRFFYKTSLALAILMVAACGAAAQNHITGIQLSRDGDNTLVSIYGERQMRVAHQSVEAKEGKPFRVVIDCLAARHGLPEKVFTGLPRSAVTAIRTSQFAVQPEEVVRVVLDINNETIYRIETENNVVTVYINDPSTGMFDPWLRGKTVPNNVGNPPLTSKSPSIAKQTTDAADNPSKLAQNKSDETGGTQEEKYASGGKPVPLQYKYKDLTSTKDIQADKTEKPARKVPSLVQSRQDKNQKPLAKSPAKVLKKTEQIQPKPQQQKMAATKTPVTSDAEPVIYGPFPPPGFKPPVSLANVGVTNAESPEMASGPDNENQPPVPGRIPGMPSKDIHKDKDQEPQQLAQIDDNDAESSSSQTSTTSTSRYRRTAAKSQRMKQTLVVQFPQRMVIKYKPESARDPFENLIGASIKARQSSSGRGLDKIPNAEAMRLVGILKSVQGKSAALLEDLDGIGYILRPGDRVQKGYLAQITNNSVFFQVNEYGWTRTIKKELEEE